MVEKVFWGKDRNALSKANAEMLEVARDQAIRLSRHGDGQEGGVIGVRKRIGQG